MPRLTPTVPIAEDGHEPRRLRRADDKRARKRHKQIRRKDGERLRHELGLQPPFADIDVLSSAERRHHSHNDHGKRAHLDPARRRTGAPADKH